MTRRLILAACASAFSGCLLAQPTPAKTPPVALKGTDPVSYFNPGKPEKGSPSVTFDFDDARYQFSSPKNRDLFAANPDRYAPQFAGLCATGIAYGKKAEADPNIFVVRDGKLYIFGDAEVREMVEKDPSLLGKAHSRWRK
jgi:hypothetical protein